MNNKHFEFTDDTVEYSEHILHRIHATRDIPEQGVKKGDIGGFVESYDNLSDHAWVYGNAKVFGDAVVSGDAWINGDAKVFGNATVFGNAIVGERARVFGDAKVYEYTKVHGDAAVCGHAEVSGVAHVCEYAMVFGNAKICGNAIVDGNAEVLGDAVVKSIKDYLVFKNCWSSGRYFTWTRSNNMWKVGCFYGTGEELIKKAYEDSEKSGKLYEWVVKSVNEMNKLLKEDE